MLTVDRSGKPDFPVFQMGIYVGEILKSTEGVSKKGRPQLVLEIEFVNGKERTKVWEYIAANDFQRLDAMLVCAGLAPGADQINADALLNREVRCELKTETSAGYAPKNRVAEWLPPKPRVANSSAAPVSRPRPAPAAAAVKDDDIPF